MKRPKVRETMAGWRLGHRQSDAQHRLLLMISEAALSQGGSGHLALRSPPGGTYSMHRSCNVQMDPDPRPVKSDVCRNEEASTRAGAVVSVLRTGEGQLVTSCSQKWEESGRSV